mmetsp:Transcript_71877/g.208175  ORF Transcript_71877/g.208175 Transcript_71877/m.208175 type:complete len:85 (+) Transcript_71877:492-746(+)
MEGLVADDTCRLVCTSGVSQPIGMGGTKSCGSRFVTLGRRRCGLDHLLPCLTPGHGPRSLASAGLGCSHSCVWRAAVASNQLDL